MKAKCPKCDGIDYIIVSANPTREGILEYRQCNNDNCFRRYKVLVLIDGTEMNIK